MRSNPTLFERIKLAREGTAVERCHAHPHLLSYTVGHHSLDLVVLITLSWMHDHDDQLPRPELLIAAAFHDVPERVTGDVPQPVKHLLGPAMQAIDQRVLCYLGVDVGLTEEEEHYLHAGDKLELWLWCWEEERRGNIAFRDWVRDYDKHFKDHPPPPSYNLIMKNVRSNGAMHRVSSQLIREMLR